MPLCLLSLPPRRPPSYCARRSSLSRSRSPLSFPGSTRLSRSRPTRRKTVELRRAREKVQREELTGRTYGGRKRRGTSPSKFPRIFGDGAFGTAGLTECGGISRCPFTRKSDEARGNEGNNQRGRARFSRKRHSHRLVLQAHLDLAEDTGEEEEEDDERPDREITPSSITLSLFLVPESEPRNRRKPTAFEILSCSGRFVQGSAAAPAERAYPSPKEGKEQRRKRERERDGEKEKEQGERGRRRSKRSERTRAAPSARQQQRPTVVSNVDQRQGG